jgi:hypothetical protein
MERLREHFERKAQRDGVILSHQDLLDYASKNKITVDTRKLRTFRGHWKDLVLFQQAVVKPKHFSSAVISSYGLCFSDFGFFHPEWKRENNGYIGFLLIVESLTKLLYACPLRDRTKASYEKCYLDAIQVSALRKIRVIISDREGSMLSKSFQNTLLEKYDIKIHFLYNHSKSYLAELYLGKVKTWLSMALSMRKSRTWYTLLPNVIKNHNSQFIKGTRLRRNMVGPHNYLEALGQIHNIPDPAALFNSSDIDQSAIKTPAWRRKLWKFAIGDECLLSVHSNFYLKNKIFFKRSLKGSWTDKVYVITRALLRNTAELLKVAGKLTKLIIALLNLDKCFVSVLLLITDNMQFISQFTELPIPRQTRRSRIGFTKRS